MKFQLTALSCASLFAASALLWAGAADARPPATYSSSSGQPFEAAIRDRPPADQEPDARQPDLKRQVVRYLGEGTAGTIVVDTSNTYLYLLLRDGEAIRYAIGVGREGFTWSGTQSVSRKAEWPDWTPPQEMITRQPYLPRWMAGGEGNPLGARAIYLGNTVYRIHGTNVPESIGKKVSSGCIRMLNEDVIDLYARIAIGTKIVVLSNQSVAGRKAVSPRVGTPRTTVLRAAAIY